MSDQGEELNDACQEAKTLGVALFLMLQHTPKHIRIVALGIATAYAIKDIDANGDAEKFEGMVDDFLRDMKRDASL